MLAAEGRSPGILAPSAASSPAFRRADGTVLQRQDMANHDSLVRFRDAALHCNRLAREGAAPGTEKDGTPTFFAAHSSRIAGQLGDAIYQWNLASGLPMTGVPGI